MQAYILPLLKIINFWRADRLNSAYLRWSFVLRRRGVAGRLLLRGGLQAHQPVAVGGCLCILDSHPFSTAHCNQRRPWVTKPSPVCAGGNLTTRYRRLCHTGGPAQFQEQCNHEFPPTITWMTRQCWIEPQRCQSQQALLLGHLKASRSQAWYRDELFGERAGTWERHILEREHAWYQTQRMAWSIEVKTTAGDRLQAYIPSRGSAGRWLRSTL